MDKAEMASLFEAFGLTELWSHLLPTLRASIKIKLESQLILQLGDSKIGGMPDSCLSPSVAACPWQAPGVHSPNQFGRSPSFGF